MDSNYAATLKKINMKVTPRRLAIMDILSRTSKYLSPEDVHIEMKTSFKNVGLPTVYRNLEDLARNGVIIKIIHPDRKLYYFYCGNSEQHHHFICLQCRKVEDIRFCGAKEIKDEVEGVLEGHVVSHLLQVNGFCKTCLSSEQSSREMEP